MICGIYKITNTINGKCYIGQSIDIQKRWSDHKICRMQFPLYRAFKKHGLEVFTFKVLIECPVERLDYYEMACIAEYNSFGSEGYNCDEGGDSHRGRECSDETRLKLSVALKGHILSDETKAKLSISASARSKRAPHSEETKAKMRLASKGNQNNKGRIHSEEAKQNMKLAQQLRRNQRIPDTGVALPEGNE